MGILKDSKETGKVPPITNREASRGKVMKLHRYYKGIMAMMPNLEAKNHFKRLMIDATCTNIEMKNRRKEKTKVDDIE